MATTVCAERALRLGLGVSLLLHGALLWLPVRGLRDPVAAASPLLTLTLKRPARAGPVPATALPPSVQAKPVPRGEPLRGRPAPRPLALPAAVLPESDVPLAASERRLNMDQLREQARDLARAPAEQLVRGGDRRPGAPAVAPDLLDRPILAALSRRIGKPLRVASEQRLADGSRMIRFVGNVCLHIPQQLSLGQENAFGPTLLVPTNCSD